MKIWPRAAKPEPDVFRRFSARRTRLLSILLAFMLVLLAVVPYVANEWLRETKDGPETRLRTMNQAVGELEQNISAISSNLNGYLLSGEPDFVLRFPTEVADARALIDQISHLGKDAFPSNRTEMTPPTDSVLSAFLQTASEWLDSYAVRIYRLSLQRVDRENLKAIYREGQPLLKDIDGSAERVRTAVEKQNIQLNERISLIRRWVLLGTVLLGLVSIFASLYLSALARSAAELYRQAFDAYRRTQKRSEDLSGEVGLLSTLLRHSPFGIMLLDEATRAIMLTNEAFEQLPFVRKDVSVPRDMKLADVLDGSGPTERFLKSVERSIETRTVTLEPNVRISSSVGESVWSMRVVPFVSADQRTYVLVIWEDITDTQQAYEKLAAEHARSSQLASEISLIIDNLDDGVILVTEAGRITAINESARKFLSMGPDSPTSIGGFPDELRQAIGMALGSETPSHRIVYFFGPGHQSVEAVVSTVSRQGKLAKSNAIVVVRDISELKRVVREKDEFLALASHELKTPVTVIDGAIQLLERAFKDSDEPLIRKLVEQLKTQGRRLRALVAQLFDYANIQTGMLKLSAERIDLASAIAAWAEEFRVIASPHRLSVHVPSHPVWVVGEQARLYQVFSNLVSNAVRYSERPGEIRIELGVAREMVRVLVADQGIGISPEDLLKLFHRYARAEGVLKRKAGLGIGLFVSSEILRAHGGRIWAEWEGLGRGSRFYFELPAIESGIRAA